MSRPAPGGRRGARGFTLIEVLISILIFSVGVLGAVGMQARALQSSTQNQDRARAAVLANDIVSTAWALQTADPTNATLAGYITTWKTRVSSPTASGLPTGTGSYTYAAGVATVTVQWKPTTMATSSTPNQYVTTFVIP